MKRLVPVLVLVLSACRNEAIRFARMLDKDAVCQALHTGVESDIADTAVCRIGRGLFTCVVNDRPSCIKIADIPAEAQP